jgi:hypothetical protein
MVFRPYVATRTELRVEDIVIHNEAAAGVAVNILNEAGELLPVDRDDITALVFINLDCYFPLHHFMPHGGIQCSKVFFFRFRDTFTATPTTRMPIRTYPVI